MTSVRNHRRRLNGSNLIGILVMTLLWSSCGIFGPSSSTQTGEDDTNRGVVITDEVETMDTIVWSKVSEEEAPPIVERARRGAKSEFKSSYNIVLLAPFDASRFQSASDRLSSRTARMIEFYAGMKYAFDRIDLPVNFNLSVIDTEVDPDFKYNFQEDTVIQNADLIIGPYQTSNIQPVAAFAKYEGKMMLSPWNTAEVTVENPFYIQLRPSLSTHADAILAYAKNRFTTDKMRILAKNDARAEMAIRLFQEANKKIEERMDADQIPTIVVDDISNEELGEDLTLQMEVDSFQGVIIPEWADEPFVIAALAKLNFTKAGKDLTVFGLPQWMEMERMDFDYYESLNVHVSSEKPLSFDDADSKALRSYYFNRYGDVPSSDAYYGMNVLQWSTYMLATYGTNFTNGLNQPMEDETHFPFKIGPVFGLDGESINYYENRHISIFEFENYAFKSVR